MNIWELIALAKAGDGGAKSMLHFKGSVLNESALPGSGNDGDTYLVDSADSYFAWDGEGWTDVGQLLSMDDVAALFDQVEDAGDAQVARIVAKGQEVEKSIPEDYSELSGDVDNVKSAIKYSESGNLLNINDSDCIENSIISSVGTISEGAGGFVTGYIPITPGKTYIFPFDVSFYGTTDFGIPVYKADKSYSKSQRNGTYSDGFLAITITGSSNAFMRVRGLTMANKDTAMVVEGDAYPTEYIPYTDGGYYKLNNAVYNGALFTADYETAKNAILANTKTIEGIYQKSVNLFNSENVVADKFVHLSGYYDGAGYSVSSPIPIEKGKTYKFTRGDGLGKTHDGIYSDSSGAYVEGFATVISDGYETFTSAYDGYAVFNLGNGDYSNTMFCVEDEYPQVFTPFGNFPTPDFRFNAWQKAYIDFENDQQNPLHGKTAIFDGDSICAANTNNERRGWALRIIDGNGMTGANVAVGGATITQGTQERGVDRHWVSAYIDTIYSNYPALDYYIFDGGTNDADLFQNHPEKKGAVDPVDFSGEYDAETFCGAFETLIYKAINYYPSAKIGYIIPPKMGPLDASTGMTGYTAETNRRRAYFDTAIEICKKWGLPYIDLWDGCLMNPSLGTYYSPGTYYADGQHPTAIGYDLFTPMIEAWMKLL